MKWVSGSSIQQRTQSGFKSRQIMTKPQKHNSPELLENSSTKLYQNTQSAVSWFPHLQLKHWTVIRSAYNKLFHPCSWRFTSLKTLEWWPLEYNINSHNNSQQQSTVPIDYVILIICREQCRYLSDTCLQQKQYQLEWSLISDSISTSPCVDLPFNKYQPHTWVTTVVKRE